jgi:hypothetical protein
METLLFRRGGFEHVPGGKRMKREPMTKEKRRKEIERLAREREGWINVLGDYIQSVEIPSLTLMRYLMEMIEETEEILISFETDDIKNKARLMYIDPRDAKMGLSHLGSILEEYARSGEAVGGVVEMLEYWKEEFGEMIPDRASDATPDPIS